MSYKKFNNNASDTIFSNCSKLSLGVMGQVHLVSTEDMSFLGKSASESNQEELSEKPKLKEFIK